MMMRFVSFGNFGRKGQLKMQQMAFMLLALTLFFALVGLFFLSFSLGNIQRGYLDLETRNAKEIVAKLASTPELTCGVHCIDMDKALVLKENSLYRGFWEVQSIAIRRIYPPGNGTKECTRGTYPDCDVLTLFSTTIRGRITPQTNFVKLCRKAVQEGNVYEKCDLGLLIVGFESNEET